MRLFCSGRSRTFPKSMGYRAGLLAVVFAACSAAAANTNGNGTSLNLPTTDLSSGTVQSNETGGRLVSAGTPGTGVVSTNAAGAKVIIEPMNAVAGNSGPAADFGAIPLAGTAPLEVQFTDMSTGGLYTIDAWSWDFGDGSAASLEQNPKHTYTAAGTYSVTLTITTTGGSVVKQKTDYIGVLLGVPAANGSGWLLLAWTVGLVGLRGVRRATVL